MSNSHVQIVKDFFAAMGRGDKQGLLALSAEDIEWIIPGLRHLGIVGDTYTIPLSGDDTDGRYCLIDMHVPPGGGPPPHRHDFENHSPFSKVKSKPPFAAKNQSWEQARRQHSSQRASFLHERFQGTGTANVHLLASRAGRILPRGGISVLPGPRWHPSPTKLRDGNEGKSRHTPPEISHGNDKTISQFPSP